VLSPELAANLGVKFGQRATILTSDRDGVMNALDFNFVGEYGQPGLPLPDKKLGFVPLALAQELLRMEGRATEIAVALHRFDDAEKVKPVLQAALGPEYEVSTWHDVASYVDDAIATQNFILNLIAGLFLFVALLGIANTMLMSVLERTREIGTMMSVGVRRRQILTLFLLEASLLGLAGGVLGAFAGGGFVLYYGYKGMMLPIPGMLVPLHVFPVVSASYILFILATRCRRSRTWLLCGRRCVQAGCARLKRSQRCNHATHTAGSAQPDSKQAADDADCAGDHFWRHRDRDFAGLRQWLHPQQCRSDRSVETRCAAGVPKGISWAQMIR
jgi:hypothetical protein